jgi:hypothetical protein
MCVRLVGSLLERLRQGFPVLRSSKPLERFDELNASLSERAIGKVIAFGLPEYLDLLQQQIGGLSSEIDEAYFSGGVG